MSRQREILAIAIGALCLGALFYTLARQHDHVYFLSAWLPAAHPASGRFGALGDYLPTFIHVYAFILLSVAVAAPAISKVIPICLAWFTLDSLFEVAQLDLPAHWIAQHLPGWFSTIPILDNTASYFLSGTFDMLDLLSIAAGSISAYITIHISSGRMVGS